MAAIDELFLHYSVQKLQQLSSRIEDCLTRISDEQVWARGSDRENAVGNLVLHLCGNVNQWIGTGIAGRPDTRQRDAEFAARGNASREELASRLTAATTVALQTLGALTGERLVTVIEVQGYRVSVLEAIYHVVEHFAQHTAQIIYATKLLTGGDLGYYKHLSPATKTDNPNDTP